MAFFIKNFRRVLRKSNFRNLGKNKYESRRRSSKPCFGCKKIGHFIADCPEEKKKNKDTKESSSKRDKSRYETCAGEAHLGQEWNSNEESNSDNEDVTTMAFKTSSLHQPSLFEDLTDDEDQGPIMCLMAKNSKVTSPNSSDDELDEEDEIASLIKQYGKSVATRIMKLIMKLVDLDETLESQEELFRLESEKSKALEKNLTNERKENKRLVESLKAKDSILLEVEESFTSEKRKVNDLTKQLSLVEDTHANLKRDNEKLQESLTSLQAIHTALEVKVNTLLESSSKASKSSKSSSPSTSNGCARCFNIDIQSCASNHAEMHAMKKEITRLTQLVKKKHHLTSKYSR
jgi:chromosome segregation ATPase